MKHCPDCGRVLERCETLVIMYIAQTTYLCAFCEDSWIESFNTLDRDSSISRGGSK